MVDPLLLLWFCITCSREIVSHMRILIDSVETLQQETYKLLGYERSAFKQFQLKQQLIQKRVSQKMLPHIFREIHISLISMLYIIHVEAIHKYSKPDHMHTWIEIQVVHMHTWIEIQVMKKDLRNPILTFLKYESLTPLHNNCFVDVF